MKKYILGNVRKIIFESNNGPYKVGLFKVKETNDEDLEEYINKVIGFTGSFAELNEEVDYIFYGEMVIHPKYGLQYSVSSYEISIPNDIDSLILSVSIEEDFELIIFWKIFWSTFCSRRDFASSLSIFLFIFLIRSS